MKIEQLVVLIPVLILLIDIGLSEGRFFCFRRLKKKNKCGGYLRNEKYANAEACCTGKGQGFADKKLKLGRNRFRCIPCSDTASSRSANNAGLPSSHSAVTSTDSSSSTTTTTTQFTWPDAARPDFAVPPEYPPPKDDNGELIVWEEWSPCSVSCGAGWRSRAKVCDKCDRNDYENVQSQPCMINFYCPVDGNWGPWFPWEACSASCNLGTRTRQRKCNYPPPGYGGEYCPGDAVAEQECNKKPCPVDGSWGEWSEFSECSSSCGPGVAQRIRQCDSPPPQYRGKNCPGPDSSTRKCEIIKCPVDGEWSLWSAWSICSATCGKGLRERRRACISPKPQHGGKACEGSATDQEECFADRPCSVDGNWGAWSDYGYCRAPRCSRGFKMRTRTCSYPSPAYGGKLCEGQQYEETPCFNDHNCPRNGSWCGWSDWNQCSSSCRENSSLRVRQRICACPSLLNGGADCQGDSLQVQECKDIPYCRRSEHTEASGDGATYDEENEQVANSNNTGPGTKMLSTSGGRDSNYTRIASSNITTVQPP